MKLIESVFFNIAHFTNIEAWQNKYSRSNAK